LGLEFLDFAVAQSFVVAFIARGDGVAAASDVQLDHLTRPHGIPEEPRHVHVATQESALREAGLQHLEVRRASEVIAEFGQHQRGELLQAWNRVDRRLELSPDGERRITVMIATDH